ncbi:Heat shock protein DnaJ [Penicillium cf. griseofulvum]|uniref:Heat shock protein DnaJ n=1 Tax=Penicillium cf. griseofulvum TaxID=2972120 RepID=A0A9W9M8N3_9EURO|nr:Heat shock protein DnaJ [Penicillium cf. griseofulvum]KAJ5445165.1 Heat shock protein DnaJ [Penicillium cf. griseofulvum]
MPPPQVTAILLCPRMTLSSTPSTYQSISTQPLRPQLHPHRRPRQLPIPPISFFSTSNPARARARDPNFYEILNVPTTASAAEIKKQFYALSMRHHPDRNRTDPDASQRFARISAAYNVLGNVSKRAVYDRDHGFHTQQHGSPGQTHTHQHPMGSHSSYAGSRPASGLSKRRTAFRGAPPSFYEQGGYGATGRQAQGWAAGNGGAGAGFGASAGAGAGAKHADPEDWEGFIRRNPLSHFNAQGHFRTQSAEDKRRRERRQEARRIDEDRDATDPRIDQTVSRFFLCSGCLIVMLVVVDLWRSVPKATDGEKKRKQRGTVSS